ncbi:MAG: glycogen/starch synthase, partial [Clostridiales Family XIII bacterium]|nr:glycogen/starch synthase [Clostridiales Family XIII bacterium]
MKTKKPKVLFVASEAMPLVKTGGLADVAGSLPISLRTLGVDVAVMIPKHHVIKEKYESQIETIAVTEIILGWRRMYLGIQRMDVGGISYYLLDNEDYFGDAIYRGGNAENEQYLFFCRAVLESLEFLDFKPDILHCNDWHTG